MRRRRLPTKSKPQILTCLWIFKSNDSIKSPLVPLCLSKAPDRDGARGRFTNLRRHVSTTSISSNLPKLTSFRA